MAGKTFEGHPCPKCGGTLRYEYRKRCVKCKAAEKERHRQRHPEKWAAWQRSRDHRPNILRQYGLTKETYDAMVTAQGGGCAICSTIPEDHLHVDHCHTTGAVRGLLCRRCNLGLGLFADDPDRLARAIAYLG